MRLSREVRVMGRARECEAELAAVRANVVKRAPSSCAVPRRGPTGRLQVAHSRVVAQPTSSMSGQIQIGPKG
jgi:hypothetical protein